MDGRRNIIAKIFLLIIMSILTISIASAENENYMIKIKPINNDISIYDEAEFNVTIINLNKIKEEFSIYSPNIDSWSIKINPSDLSLSPHTSESSLVRIKPKPNIEPGKEYGVQLNIRSKNTGELSQAYAFIDIKSQEQLNQEYQSVIAIETNELGKIDPGEILSLTIDLENKNVKDLNDILIIVSSDLFYKETRTSLEPLKKKTVQFPLPVSSITPPIQDNLIIKIKIENETLISKSLPYEVNGIEKYNQNLESSKSFLRAEHTITFVNEGNLKTVAEYKQPVNFLNYYFINSDQDSEFRKVDGEYYKVYSVILEPSGRFTLNITISYMPVLYAVIIIIVLIFLYYVMRSPIIIKKTVSSIKTKEDTLSELKVLIHIKNRTKKSFEDVIILDRVPKITEIGKDFEIGTIKPVKIMNHEKKGTIAKWELNALDSYEERVIAYKLFTNLKILGGLTLPVAILKYRIMGGREKVISSNKVNLVIKKFCEQK